MPLATPARAEQIQRGLMPLMAQITRQWRRAIDRQLQPLGLTEATWLPLLHLARASEPMRQKDLAASLSLDSSSVVRLLDGLQVAGFIERWEGEDRRAKTVHLTVQGRAVVKKVEEVVGKSRARLFAAVPPRDVETAFRLLEQINTALLAVEEGGA
ncbi:MAG TPA: MarR family transcriptional regulator [Burkholderiales bacterium]|jgi:MarR family transcriptional regulator for hemolysin